MILPLIFALLNRLRGSDWGKPFTSDGVIAAVQGITIGGLALWHGYGWQHSGVLGLIVWAGMWIWAAPAWGAGFAAIHGRWRANGKLSRFVEGIVQGASNRGVLYMSLRGLLGLVPLACGLAVCGHYLAAGLLAGVGAAQGAVYWAGGIHQRFTGKDTGVPISEILMGGLIGAAFMAVGV